MREEKKQLTAEEMAAWPDQSEMIYHMPYLEDMASRCSVIIEIGCGHGNGSTRAFERGLERSTHPNGSMVFISVDDNPDKPDVKPQFFNWEKLTADSRDPEVVKRAKELSHCLLLGQLPVDLLYIDTDHTYDQLAAELANWAPLASPETIWLFHDTWMFSSYNLMTDAILNFCLANPEWEYVEITRESHGMGMMRWKQSSEK